MDSNSIAAGIMLGIIAGYVAYLVVPALFLPVAIVAFVAAQVMRSPNEKKRPPRP